MTNHVTSLELSKKLKKAGVKQESEFYWLGSGVDHSIASAHHKSWKCDVCKHSHTHLASAFLASELLEILNKITLGNSAPTPKAASQNAYYWFEPHIKAIGRREWEIQMVSDHWPKRKKSPKLTAKSLPEVAGDMVLWCKSNNYLTQ